MKEIKKYIIENKKVSIGAVVLMFFLIISIFVNIILSTKDEYSGDVLQNKEVISSNFSADQMSVKMRKGPSSGNLKSDLILEQNEDSQDHENSIRKVIKNGNLSLIVKNIDIAKKQIKNISEKNSGFINNSNFSENKNFNYENGRKKSSFKTKSGYFDIKIPNANFEKGFEEFKEIALKVNSESVSGQDVTEQFADLETQIKNKKAEVDSYRKLLGRSGSIKDILQVTKYLNNAQTELERKQGRLNRLSNQVTLSSIRINIISEKDVEVFGVVWSPLTEIKFGFSAMMEGVKNFADNVIAFVFKLPVYILYIGGVILAGRIIFIIGKKLKTKIWIKKSKK